MHKKDSQKKSNTLLDKSETTKIYGGIASIQTFSGVTIAIFGFTLAAAGTLSCMQTFKLSNIVDWATEQEPLLAEVDRAGRFRRARTIVKIEMVMATTFMIAGNIICAQE